MGFATANAAASAASAAARFASVIVASYVLGKPVIIDASVFNESVERKREREIVKAGRHVAINNAKVIAAMFAQ